MSDWQYRVSFRDFFEDEGIGIEKKAQMAASLVEAVRQRMLRDSDEEVRFQAEELAEVVDAFKCIDAPDESDEFAEADAIRGFDACMYELYNIADTNLDAKFGGKKLLWVET